MTMPSDAPTIDAPGSARRRGLPRAGSWLNKVPLVTATFWVIKVLSTTIGETFADYLAVDVGLGPAITDGLVFAVLVLALTGQFRARRYVPWRYWLSVVLVSIFGTQLTDFFTDTLGVSLYLSTSFFSVVLVVVFVVWHRQEMTLSIKSVDTPRREAFYWGAILTTFALGTAAGDLATEALALGFRNGTLIFGGLFLVMLAVWRVAGWEVLAFWAAYVLTRPLGASIGDLLTQDRRYGGLGVGASRTSLLFFAVIVVLVAREQFLVARRGVAEKGRGPSGGRARDAAWATAGAAVVVLAGSWFAPASPSDAAAPGPPVAPAAVPAGSQSAGSLSAGRTAAPTTPARRTGVVSKLGDLSAFGVIVDDVLSSAQKGDLPGAKARVKDLEVAWDGAEAGLKPKSPADWHRVDDKVDATLTALRADRPTQADSLAALRALRATLDQLQGTA